jgi:hypothetical protein
MLRAFLTYKKSSRNAIGTEKTALKEQYKLNQNSTVLFHKHLCMVLKKV